MVVDCWFPTELPHLMISTNEQKDDEWPTKSRWVPNEFPAVGPHQRVYWNFTNWVKTVIKLYYTNLEKSALDLLCLPHCRSLRCRTTLPWWEGWEGGSVKKRPHVFFFLAERDYTWSGAWWWSSVSFTCALYKKITPDGSLRFPASKRALRDIPMNGSEGD